MAVDAPAGPAPITRASASISSRMRHGYSVFLGQEAVREGQHPEFFGPPDVARRGPRGRDFVSGKARLDTLDGVLPRDRVRSQQADQTTTNPRKHLSPGLYRNERPTSPG